MCVCVCVCLCVCVRVFPHRSWLATSKTRWTSSRSWSAAACVRRCCPSRTTNKPSAKTVTCGSGAEELFSSTGSNQIHLRCFLLALASTRLTGHELNLNAKCLLWRFIYLDGAVIKPPTLWYLPMHHSHRLINIVCQTFLLPSRYSWNVVPLVGTEREICARQCCSCSVCVCVCVSLPASSLMPFSRSPPGVCCHTRPARRWRSDVASCWIPSPDCQSLRVSATFHLPPPPFHSHTLDQPSPPVTFNIGLHRAPPLRSSLDILDFKQVENFILNKHKWSQKLAVSFFFYS